MTTDQNFQSHEFSPRHRIYTTYNIFSNNRDHKQHQFLLVRVKSKRITSPPSDSRSPFDRSRPGRPSNEPSPQYDTVRFPIVRRMALYGMFGQIAICRRLCICACLYDEICKCFWWYFNLTGSIFFWWFLYDVWIYLWYFIYEIILYWINCNYYLWFLELKGKYS